MKIAAEIMAILMDTLETTESTICLDKTLDEIGFDSLSFIRVVVSVETKYQFEFDDEMLLLDRYEKVGDLVSYICGKVGEESPC